MPKMPPRSSAPRASREALLALTTALLGLLLASPSPAAADLSYEFKWGAHFGDGSSGSSNGEFLLPTDVAYSNGNVYVSDLGNNRIQRFTDAAGNESAPASRLLLVVGRG